MPSLELNNQTSDLLVHSSWESVMSLVESGHPLSSEKTLCFLFATEILKSCNFDVQVDFENHCYSSLQGKSKYLDLLISDNYGYKIAIEFKLPQKSINGNSNQTQTRLAVYRDIARLNWLKSNSLRANACYFLMATNEDAYLNNTTVKEFQRFLTRENHRIEAGNDLVVEDIPLSEVEFEFSWKGIVSNSVNRKSGKYAWLTPIKI